jgi:hypothetical protein
MDLQPYQVYVCCPSWCPTSIREDRDDGDISWYTPASVDIRKSVLDGTYSHCNHQVCPSLNRLLNTDDVPVNFIPIDEFKEIHKINTLDDVENMETYPEHVLFGFDRSCNFKCPSCRKDLVPNDDEESNDYKEKMKTLEIIETKFSSNIKSILITGSGDPFYSKIYRNYLLNFDSSKYPKLEQINLITNGKLLTKKMWNSMKAKKHVKNIEVSIDAGTEYTYENVTRLNGKWDILIENLKFISTLKTLNSVTCSFVVSEKNFLEMNIFHTIISNIFESSNFEFRINYTQHVHWGDGAYTEDEVKRLQVFDQKHHFFNTFLEELFELSDKKNVSHNFHHLLVHKKHINVI